MLCLLLNPIHLLMNKILFKLKLKYTGMYNLALTFPYQQGMLVPPLGSLYHEHSGCYTDLIALAHLVILLWLDF